MKRKLEKFVSYENAPQKVYLFKRKILKCSIFFFKELYKLKNVSVNLERNGNRLKKILIIPKSNRHIIFDTFITHFDTFNSSVDIFVPSFDTAIASFKTVAINSDTFVTNFGTVSIHLILMLPLI